jgi:hypothetical protein
MSFAHGASALGEEVPLVGNFLNGKANANGDVNGNVNERSPLGIDYAQFGGFIPYIKDLFAEMNPRLLSGMKIADMVERLAPVVAGKKDLATALVNLKNDASFRVIGDLPVGPLLKMFGISIPNEVDQEGSPVQSEPDLTEAFEITE